MSESLTVPLQAATEPHPEQCLLQQVQQALFWICT
jgi:hypothetical protein